MREGKKMGRKRKGEEERGRGGWKLDIMICTKPNGNVIFTIFEGPYLYFMLKQTAKKVYFI